MKTIAKNTLKTTIATLAMAFAFSATTAHADTAYYVYKNGDKCEITMKSPEKFNKGSDYKYVGKETTRSGAKKKGKLVGCTSF